MTLLLSIPEFLSQHPEMAECQHQVRQLLTVPLEDASGRSHGYRQSVNLRPGLNILIDDYTLQEDLIIETRREAFATELCIEISFMLSAHNHNEGLPAYHNFLDATWWDFAGGGFPWQSDERVLKFDIHLEQAVFQALWGDQLETLPASLDQIVQSVLLGQSDQRFRHLSATTPEMRLAIHQMLHCPYQGPTRWLYWESKVLELLALRLAKIAQSVPRSVGTSTLKPDDLDRIHYAREILHQRLADPPSLLELARLVGLNDCKLKAGFKQTFGTTVFEDLRRQRLDQARQILQERQISVAAAAAAVGYTSKGHFASAFRKQFGINPSELHR